MKKIKVEAEGGELIIRNSYGDYAIIPKINKIEVQDMIKSGCNNCIDALVATLPTLKEYAEQGTVIPTEPVTRKTTIENPLAINSPVNVREYKTNMNIIGTNVNYSHSELIRLKNHPENLTNADKLNLKNVGSVTKKNPSTVKMIVPLEGVDIVSKRGAINSNIKEDSDLKLRQKFLLENDFYDTKLIKMDSKEDFGYDNIKGIQTQLVSNGFSLPKSTNSKGELDGKIGPETLTAINKYNEKQYDYEVDGIVGDRTNKANDLYKKSNLFYKTEQHLNSPSTLNLESIDIERTLIKTGLKDPKNIVPSSINKTYEDEIKKEVLAEEFIYQNVTVKGEKDLCKRYVNNVLAEYGEEQIAGDAAWDMMKYTGKHYEMTYSLFAEKPKLSNSTPIIRKYIEDKIKEDMPNRAKIAEAPPLSIVNIYNRKSSYQEEAYANGNTTIGTHAGIVVIKDNNKYVQHEINGKTIFTPIEEMINGKGDLSIIAVDENTKYKDHTETFKIKYYANTMELNARYGDLLGSKEGAIAFAKSKDYANQFGKIFNLPQNDIANLSKAAMLVIAQESAFGKADVFYETGFRTAMEKYFSGKKIPIINSTGKERSEGYAQIKEQSNFSPELLKALNINDVTLSDLSQSGLNTSFKAAQIKLLKNYQVLSKSVKKYKININEQDLWALTVKGYNFDINGVNDSLIKYKSIKKIEEAYKKEAEAKGEEYENYPASENFRLITIK
jgi:peptidoglycan hydrolase-like protein with peptidoglycan-binding domain